MKHTKLWRTIVMIALLLLSLLLLASCQTNAQNEPSDEIANEPGNDSTSDPMDEELSDTSCEHEMVAVFAQSPTCSKIGWNDYEACSLCGYMMREEIPALGHDYVDGVCSRCTAIPVSDHLKFYPSYDGTCTVHCSGNCTDREVVIPHISPDGYKVTDISFSHYTCKGIEKLTFHEDCAITEIKERAFYRMDTLKSIELPAGVTSIGKEAFAECDALESVTFADGAALESIGEKAFYQCKSLQEFEWSALEELTVIEPYAFAGCASLEHVEIPKSLTKIDGWAFDECSSLKTVSFAPDGVLEYIGGWVFNKCVSLEGFEIPSTVTYLDGDAFANILNKPFFETVDGVTYLGNWALNWNWTKGDTIRLREGTVGVGDQSMSGDGDCKRIELPASMRYIAPTSFYDRIALREIVVDENNPVYHSKDNCLIETATKTLIMGCNTSVIPSDGSVTTIGPSAFYESEGLTAIEIPATVTTIGSRAFMSCTALRSITVPSSVRVIEELAFWDCEALAQITLGDGVTEIGSRAFSDMPRLKNVTIPASVTRLCMNAFFDNDALETVVFEDTDGWYATAESIVYEDKPVDVSDPALNAEKLKTYVYSSEPRYWYRK